jgi:hypothetical protein
VAALSKELTVSLSNTGVVASNPTGGIDVCVRLFCVCVVLCVVSRLSTAWSALKGILPQRTEQAVKSQQIAVES